MPRRENETLNTEVSPEIPKVSFREKEAAKYIGFSTSFLKHGRRTGPIEGRVPPPPFIAMGGGTIRYLRSDLDDWLSKFPKKLCNYLDDLQDQIGGDSKVFEDE